MADSRDIHGKNKKFTGTTGVIIPTGTTGQRVNNTAQLRFNSTTNLMEYYTGSDWKSIDSPPTITQFTLDGGSDVTTAVIDNAAGGNATIQIKGSLFDTTGATVTFVGTSETISTQSITRNSANLLTVTVARSDFDNTNEPYAIKVTNGSGLSAELADAITQNRAPTFATSADTNLGTIYQGNSNGTPDTLTTAAATDPDSDSITHTISAGALPSGLSLTSAGAFSGTVAGDATIQEYTFTVSATDGTATTTRQFKMSVAAVPQIEYLVVAGGGGGGGANDNGDNYAGAGAGGAGGYRTGSTNVPSSTTFTVTVGAGGQAGDSSDAGSQGGNSALAAPGFTTVTSAGGGFGNTENQDGGNGGSGGGGGAYNGNTPGRSGQGGNGNTPSVSPSQGNNGGNGHNNTGPHAGGGGGGANAAGENGNSDGGGNGGAGTANSITGSSVTYAGGGGGGVHSGGNQGSGGAGGGGQGGQDDGPVNGQSGTSNTGGGGGGSGPNSQNNNGGAGGSGVVILKMPTSSYNASNTGSPTVTTSGSDTIIKFTSSGSHQTG